MCTSCAEVDRVGHGVYLSDAQFATRSDEVFHIESTFCWAQFWLKIKDKHIEVIALLYRNIFHYLGLGYHKTQIVAFIFINCRGKYF